MQKNRWQFYERTQKEVCRKLRARDRAEPEWVETDVREN
jgi:hypothetical protein